MDNLCAVCHELHCNGSSVCAGCLTQLTAANARLAEAESILNAVTLQLTPELCERIRAFLNHKETPRP